jgi:myo-inositol-hexaphosphate 3-phosphohydrolase
MNWEKKEPAKKIFKGCLNCSTASSVADLERTICVGFGAAYVTKNNELIYDGEQELRDGKEPKKIQFFDDMAKLDPDNDWQITFYGPWHGETYQRQGDNNWVCIESNEGFA